MAAPPEPAALTEAQLAALRTAKIRRRKIARAIGVARVSGWVTAMFAAMTLAWALGAWTLGTPDWQALAIGCGMVLVTCGEFMGAGRVRRYDPRGAIVLGCNQLFFGALLIGYAAWGALASLQSPASSELAELDPELAAEIGALTTSIMLLIYAGVALGGALGCGLASLYYFTRARHIRRFRAETPDWVIQTLRAAA
ncbi:MAG: hypothetical protein ACF8R7_02750 [Phycisphaerales bacterium JB039]